VDDRDVVRVIGSPVHGLGGHAARFLHRRDAVIDLPPSGVIRERPHRVSFRAAMLVKLQVFHAAFFVLGAPVHSGRIADLLLWYLPRLDTMKAMQIQSHLDVPTRCVDLLIVGAGPAGMAAAIFAKLRGLDVLLIEKSDKIGGTAATSAGTLWIPENTQGKAAGDKDSISEASVYLDSLIATHTPRTRRQRAAYLSTGAEAIDFLEANTEVKFLPCGLHPDYHAKFGAATRGRAIVPAPFDARVLGRDFDRVRPPIPEFMILGGMMVGKMDIPRLLGRFHSAGNFIYSARLFLRYLSDRLRYSRDQVGDGQCACRAHVLFVVEARR
jgi:hypothetical protein